MGGVLPNGWFIMENPKQKWMMTGGTPMTQEIPWIFHHGKTKYHWICHWIILNIFGDNTVLLPIILVGYHLVKNC